MNANLYCNKLDKLNAGIKEKRPALASRKGIVFNHDNARPHTAMVTQQKLNALGWEVLGHPPYSPAIAPSDYYMLRSLQNYLTGKKFKSFERVSKAVADYFNSKDENFYKIGIYATRKMATIETPLHPEKLTVWCALWAGGIIGPYFFKNDEGHNVTVNGDRYRAMIANFFIPELNNYDVQELWFQQDGATCLTARATIDLLKDTFRDRLISRFGPVNWPPRSCELTSLHYFLWGYGKSLVYVDKPQTLDHLEDNIRRVIADIRLQMLEKVIENWTSRLDYIRGSRGSPMPEILFKM
ncbi:histone-lysine N-methyltransferase SETMAR [Trichonephila clavipes]|nr:histone-lysine N-methyltransferase SETMAR [Trichonephila clavipes]